MRNERKTVKTTHKIYRKALFVFCLLAVFCSLFFISGCKEPFNTSNCLEEPGISIPQGMGYIRLMVKDANSRTIMPGSPFNNIEEYILEFKNPDYSALDQDIPRNKDNLTDPIFLQPGNYNLLVTAYLTGDLAVAEGKITGITILAGKKEEYTVVLKPFNEDGNGTFNWVITFEDSLELTAANMRIIPLSGGTPEQSVDFLSGTPPYIGHSDEVSLVSGQYSLIFNLTNEKGISIVWREVLHVYQNLVSVFQYTFTEDYFNDPGFTVVIMPNNGELYTTHNYFYGSVLSIPAEPSDLTGYVFGGWFTDNITLQNEYIFPGTVTGDIVLYAKWVPVSYNIHYEPNGGFGTMVFSSFNYNEPQALRNNSFLKAGHSFTGWNTEINGSGTSYIDREVLENLLDTAGTITLYAQWTKNQYTVTFNIMNGTGTAPASQTADYEDSIIIPGAGEFSRTGFIFAGWNTISNVPGTPYSPGDSYTVTENIIMYAQWTRITGAAVSVYDGANTMDFSNLEEALDSITASGNYEVRITTDQTLTPYTRLFLSGTNITMAAVPAGNLITVQLTDNGNLFKIENGFNLTLNAGITLRGHENNTEPLIHVAGGIFTMNVGSLITHNTTVAGNGGGLYITGGTVNIFGGEISGNKAVAGGGVYYEGGALIVGGAAKIRQNTNIGAVSDNLYIANGNSITLGTGGGSPADGMEIYVNAAVVPCIIVESGANVRSGKYFHAEQAGMTVAFYGDDTTLRIIDDPNNGRNGTPGSPFRVHDLLTLYRVGTQSTGWTLGASYVMERNFELTAVNVPLINDSNWIPIGSPDSSFTGTFDGGNYSITGLRITSGSNIGFFRAMQSTATVVSNLRLEEVHITGSGTVGGLAGTGGGTVDNCFVSGTIYSTGQYVGGLFGGAGPLEIKNTHVSASVGRDINRVNNTGGFVGSISNTLTINNSYVTGNVTGGINIGGIIGNAAGNTNTVTIKNSYVTGNVSGTGTSVGGIIGNTTLNNSVIVNIENCYVSGNVTGNSNVGGIAGLIRSGEIKNCIVMSESIKTISSYTTVGRIFGAPLAETNAVFINNRAWKSIDIRTNAAADGTGGLIKNTESDANGIDGLAIIANEVKTRATWESGAGFVFGNAENAPWVWNNENIPRFYNQTLDWLWPSYLTDNSVNVGITIEIKNLEELVTLPVPAREVTANTNTAFTAVSGYVSYTWYIDGIMVSNGPSNEFNFNRPPGIYELVVVVTNNSGETRSGRCRVYSLR